VDIPGTYYYAIPIWETSTNLTMGLFQSGNLAFYLFIHSERCLNSVSRILHLEFESAGPRALRNVAIFKDVLGFLSKRSRVAIITRILLLYKVSEFTYSFAKVSPIIVEFNPRSPTVKLQREPEKE